MDDTKDSYRCSNPNCGITFDKPKLLPVCPRCKTEVDENKKAGCQNYFGYLGQRSDSEGIPEECVECEKSIECMLEKEQYSQNAVKEIKKWF